LEERHLPTVGLTNTGAYDLEIWSGRPNSHIHNDADATTDGDVHPSRRPDQLLVSFDQESKAALAGGRINRRLNLESIAVSSAARDYDVAALDRDPWPTAAPCEAFRECDAGVGRERPVSSSNVIRSGLRADIRDLHDLSNALAGLEGELEPRRRNHGSEALC
jgi:hypothetical protein